MSRARLLLAALIGGLALLGELLAVRDGSLGPGDGGALRLMGHLRCAAGVDVARVLTWLGAFPVVAIVVVLAVVVLVRRGARHEGAALLAGFALTVLLVHVLKGAVDRPRPTHPLTTTHDASFPSGHAAYAAALVPAALAMAPSLRSRAGGRALVAAALVAAVLVAVTRMYLRAHYFSDVVGAAGLTLAVFAVSALAVAAIRHNVPL